MNVHLEIIFFTIFQGTQTGVTYAQLKCERNLEMLSEFLFSTFYSMPPYLLVVPKVISVYNNVIFPY